MEETAAQTKIAPKDLEGASQAQILVGRAAQAVPRAAELSHPLRFVRDHRFAVRLQREGYTGIGSRRARSLMAAARKVEREGIAGAIVDCGVWNGGSTIFLGCSAPSREVWAYDSFEGLPAPGEEDVNAAPEWQGEMVGSIEMLKTGFDRYAGRVERLHVVKGWFDQTFPETADDVGDVAVLHIDADWYEPVILALETFYPRLRSGGVVLIDDLGNWEGAVRAVDDFRQRHAITAPLVMSHFWTKP